MLQAQFLELINFLDQYFSSEKNKEKIELFIDKAINENPWFTDSLVRTAMNAIQKQFFSPFAWQDFFIKHPEKARNKSNIGLILAGNLPGIGLHDLLMVISQKRHILFVKIEAHWPFYGVRNPLMSFKV